MQSLQQGALLKKLAIGLSVMGGALICLPVFAQAKQIIAQVEPISAEIEPMPETSPNPELDEEMPAAGDIVDVAINSGSFATLITALETAGLVDTLSGEGPYTVFAPTDEAFAALPEGAIEKLLMPENQAILEQILTYHVVPGELTSGDLVSGSVTTVEGSDVIFFRIVGNDGTFRILSVQVFGDRSRVWNHFIAISKYRNLILA